MVNRNRLLRTTITGTAKSADADWYSTDIKLHANTGSMVRITICVCITTASVLELTLDGTNYYALNNNNKLKTLSWYIFEMRLPSNSSLNLRSDKAVTVNHCSIEEAAQT